MKSITTIIHRKNLAWINFSLLFLLILSCQKDQTVIQSPVGNTLPAPEQTDDGWNTASPEEVNLNSSYLIDMLEYLDGAADHNVHAILVVKDDRLVFEQYYRGHVFLYSGEDFLGEEIEYNRETLQSLHSVSKSFTSIAIGLAGDLGFLPSINDSLFSFFPEYAHLCTPEKTQITLKHLLTMTSGFEWNEWDVPLSSSQNDVIRLWRVADPLAYVLAKPVVTTPGNSFYYNGGNTHLLGEIIRKISNQNLDWFLRLYLFELLGITDSHWAYFPDGVVDAGGGLSLQPRAMAKIGYLFLNGGIWEGNQLISQEWIAESTTPYIFLPQLGWAEAYAYQWWIKSYRIGPRTIPVYFAGGWGGQNILIIESLNMVVIFTGSNYTAADPSDFLMMHFILPAVDSL
ncbi:MAG: serine hydrolase [bacterium]|nr:MAG: serine hydrolase [bacterium]